MDSHFATLRLTGASSNAQIATCSSAVTLNISPKGFWGITHRLIPRVTARATFSSTPSQGWYKIVKTI
jgi:hypothetical protein